MRAFQVENVVNNIKNEFPYYSIHVKLIIPKLLANSRNERDFFILFELSKFHSTRNLILSIIKKDQNVMEKLEELVKKRTNKTLLKKMKFAIKKLENGEHINQW